MATNRINRLCGARLRRKPGFYCKRLAARGHLRCRLHGGTVHSGKHVSEPPDHRFSLARANAAVSLPHRQNPRPGGLARADRATRLPNGQFAPEPPRPPRDQMTTRALSTIRVIQMARRKSLPTPPVGQSKVATKPWTELTKAERLNTATDLALGIVKDILELGVDPSDVKLLAQVKDTALTVISQAIRLGESELRMRDPAARVGSVEEFYRRYDDGSSEESER